MSKKNLTTKTNSVYVFPSTKGGVGKSTSADHIVPFMLLLDPLNANKKIKIFELDDNNEARIQFDDSRISISTFKINEADGVLFDLSDELIDSDDSSITLIDAGGGNDTKAVLKYLNDNLIKNCNYFIPILAGENIKNAKETISEIKKYDPSGEITLLLNRVSELNKEKILSEFWNVYGDENIGEESQIESLNIDKILYVPNLTIFSKLSSLKKSLHDVYHSTLEKEKNIQELRSQWKKDGTQKQFFGMYKFGKECVDGINTFLIYNKIRF